MPTFQYEAMTSQGKSAKGTVTANSEAEAAAQIRGQGMFPTALRAQKVAKKAEEAAAAIPEGAAAAAKSKAAKEKEKEKAREKAAEAAPKKARKGFFVGGINRQALTTFTRQFATLQNAGLPILRSLQILSQQQKKGALKRILTQVQEDVSSGSTLSDAMARHPKAFDRLYTKMIAAGEVAGVMEMILQRLSDFLEKSASLRRKIKGAMIYPAVVILVAVTIISFIMVAIVPKFETIFRDFGAKLPWLTAFLIDASRWMAGPLIEVPKGVAVQPYPGILVVMVAPVGIWIGLKLLRKIYIGRYMMDWIVLMIPGVGALVRKASIARFTRTLGTLIKAGVPILDAVNITKETTANAVYAKALSKVHDSVRQGDSFAEPLRNAKVCDAIVTNMIDVGEETGELDKMLLKVADNYDEEVDVAVGSLVKLLEPVMVVVLGVAVGGIVISIFLPLVELIKNLT